MEKTAGYQTGIAWIVPTEATVKLSEVPLIGFNCHAVQQASYAKKSFLTLSIHEMVEIKPSEFEKRPRQSNDHYWRTNKSRINMLWFLVHTYRLILNSLIITG